MENVENKNKETGMKKLRNNKAFKWTMAIGAAIAIYTYGNAALNADDQERLNKELEKTGQQQIQIVKEISKANNEANLELEKAKLEAQVETAKEIEKIKQESAKASRGESPVMDSTKQDFKNSIIIDNNNSSKNKQDKTKSVAESKSATRYDSSKITEKNLNLPKKKGETDANGVEKTESYSKEEIELIIQNMKSKNLQTLQESFFNPNYKTNENTINVLEQKENTIKIQTRYAMTTTIVFEFPIKNYIVGDATGFEINEIPDMENMINIRPLLIGIDTNLTVFTTDKRVYSFYLYSTDYRAKTTPAFIVNVKTPYTREEIIREIEEQEGSPISSNTESKQIHSSGAQASNINYTGYSYNADKNYKGSMKVNEEYEYVIIGEGKKALKVKRSEIDRRYEQKAKNKYKHLLARNVFSNKAFTFFEYDRTITHELPAIWEVIDGKDSPIKTRVIGNYVVVDSIADKFTVRQGDAYVCVNRKKGN